MSQLLRVLKPSGRILFLEHGVIADANVARWQRRLDCMQRLFADGCTLPLNVAELLAAQPFSAMDIETFHIEEAPETHGYMYQGVARK